MKYRRGRPFFNRLSSLTEAAWAGSFALAHWLVRPTCARWSSPGSQRILALAPHPDDEAVGCAGTLWRHKLAGDTVHICFVSDGRGSRAMGLEAGEMASRRRQEAETAARLLDATYTWLGLPEGDWTAVDLQPPLQTLLNQFAPHLIYAPSRVDFHSEHHKVAYTLAHCLLSPNLTAVVVRVYQVQVPLTAVLTNIVTPIGDVAAQSTAAIQAHATQRESTARTLRMRHYAARFYGLPEQAEPFWQLSAANYCALHLSPLPWSSTAYRSLRQRPFSDPLAYSRGYLARQHLRSRLSIGS